MYIHICTLKNNSPSVSQFLLPFPCYFQQRSDVYSPKTCKEPLDPGKCSCSVTFQGGWSPRVAMGVGLFHQKLNEIMRLCLVMFSCVLRGTQRTNTVSHLLCHSCSGKSSLGDVHSRCRTGLVHSHFMIAGWRRSRDLFKVNDK
jgi:hypothetical protein